MVVLNSILFIADILDTLQWRIQNVQEEGA